MAAVVKLAAAVLVKLAAAVLVSMAAVVKLAAAGVVPTTYTMQLTVGLRVQASFYLCHNTCSADSHDLQ